MFRNLINVARYSTWRPTISIAGGGPMYLRAFASVTTTLLNDKIRAPTMRVIFVNGEGKQEWKIMDRSEALNFAKQAQLDLVLGTICTMLLIVFDIACNIILSRH